MIKPVITWERPTSFPLKENYRRIKLIVQYDGTNYYGFQLQKDLPTIQGELEKALKSLIKEDIRVFCSGRTDSKVHASYQVCHFDCLNKSIPPVNFKDALNTKLSNAIRVKESKEVDETFHSRFTTLYREYTYKIKDYNNVTPFDNNYTHIIRKYPNIDLLNQYAKIILGPHDFSSFCSTHDQSKSKVRDVYECYWEYKKDFLNNDELHFKIKANAFLWNMVRTLCGSMLEFASKGITKEEFKKILESKDRTLSGNTASSSGLYLTGIWYEYK